MFTINQVVRELASKRLPEDRTFFSQLAPELFDTIHPLWGKAAQTTLDLIREGKEGFQATTEINVLALKTLKKFL